MTHSLLTDAQRAQLLANGHAQRYALRSGRDDIQPLDPYPVVKLFTPAGGATWLLTELDPESPDLAFGLCDLGLGEPELGYVSLTELRELRGLGGIPAIERDEYFHADKRLSAYAEEARHHRRVVT